MAFYKFRRFILPGLAVVLLVGGLVGAVSQSQQKQENRSHASGFAPGDLVQGNTTLPSSNAARNGPQPVIVSGLQPGATYNIIVGGHYQYQMYTNTSETDAQWDDWQQPVHNCFCRRVNKVDFNGSALSASDFQSSSNPNHEYTFPWIAPANGTLQIEITDTVWSDNSGPLYFRIYYAALPPNVAPTANAGSPQTITLPTSSVNLTGSGTDSDGSIVSYLWTQTGGPSGPTISSAGSAATPVTGFTTAGTYVFTLKVTDDRGGTNTSSVTITVNAPLNATPIANAGVDQTINVSQTMSLAGSGTDPDGTIASYAWSVTSIPTGAASPTITTPASASTTVTNFNTVGTYVLTLKVTDNKGAVGTDSMTVTVNPAPNKPPVANAGPDVVLNLPNNSILLDGTKSADPDGTITKYQWVKISGPTQNFIVTSDQPETEVDDLVQGTYVFRLTVTDDAGATGVDTVQVTVNTQLPTKLTFDILLHGIGSAGDNVNPNGGGGNYNLVHLQRALSVEVIDGNGNVIASNPNGVVIFNSQSGSFKGTVDMGTDIPTSGTYGIRVKMAQSLKMLRIQAITVAQTTVVPQMTLVTGDVNNDNAVSINIQDYNILLGCYSDFTPAVDCDSVRKAEADLTDDGNVNFADLNLFLRELNTTGGQ